MKKTCQGCGLELDASSFNRKGVGLQPTCKECNRISNKRYYSENKEKHRANVARRNSEIRKSNTSFVREIKESTPCADCNIKYPYYVMDFDHLRDKERNVSRMSHDSGSLDRIKAEIAKCELVCANCHRIRTYKRNNN